MIDDLNFNVNFTFLPKFDTPVIAKYTYNDEPDIYYAVMFFDEYTKCWHNNDDCDAYDSDFKILDWNYCDEIFNNA